MTPVQRRLAALNIAATTPRRRLSGASASPRALTRGLAIGILAALCMVALLWGVLVVTP